MIANIHFENADGMVISRNVDFHPNHRFNLSVETEDNNTASIDILKVLKEPTADKQGIAEYVLHLHDGDIKGTCPVLELQTNLITEIKMRASLMGYNNTRKLALAVGNVSESTLSRYFNGKTILSSANLEAIADALGAEWRLVSKR